MILKSITTLIASLALAASASAASSPGLPPSVVYGGNEAGPVSSYYLPGDTLDSGGYVAELYLGSDDTMSKSCGRRTAWGAVKLKSVFRVVTLFTYRSYIDWSWCGYKVTSVNRVWDEPVDSCCQWGWAGNASKWNTPAGGANVTSYTKGHFHACALWIAFCKDRYPSVQLTVNGNGNVTGYVWDVG